MTRAVLVAGTVFVSAAFVQLFVLTAHTARFFAWTVTSPLSAAVIGAFYGASILLAGLSATQRRWSDARAGVAGVWLFLWLTLAATLIHRRQFHFHGSLLPAVAAWAWLALYIVQPLALSAAWLAQVRQGRPDRTRAAPVPTWYRGLAALTAVAVLTGGIALFAENPTLIAHWPWKLVPLTAQVIGAWLVAVGVLLLSVVREADWQRLRATSWSLVLLAVLLTVAGARYSSLVHDSAAAWIWWLLPVVLAVLGAVGSAMVHRAGRPGESSIANVAA